MVIRKGYKQTELGIVPKDWETKSLSECEKITMGQSPESKYYNKSGDGLPLIQGNADIENRKTIVRVFTSEFPKIGKVDDIIMTVRAPVGNIAKATFDCCLGRGVCSISSKNNYLYHYLIFIENRWKSMSTGSIFDSINYDGLSKLEIKIPKSTKEQELIAKSLSDIDNLIHSLESIIQKKKNIKQGAMQELLTGKRRLEGFSEEWNTKRIIDFTDVTSGGTPSTLIKEYWNGDIRWMNSGELNLKKVFDVEGRITPLGLKKSATKLIPKNCILIGLAGQGKTRGTVAMNYVELCINQSIGAIKPNESFNPEFLYYNLDLRYEELRKMSSDSEGRGGLNLTLLRNISVYLPSNKKEQDAIVKILSDMDSEIEQLEKQLEKYTNLKQAMMQKLLTGEIRLV
ncbi:MAG: restriction endonuclease subunit S [Candidatus Nitrosopelagicus sp.]|nr:restriction endonuclease subunit S [Candidatus Nitrosopelagicus sp.]